MYFNLANHNVKEAYPLIPVVLNVNEKYYKETGLSDYLVEINTIEDLLTLEAACKATEPLFDGLIIKGMSIGILRKGEFLND